MSGNCEECAHAIQKNLSSYQWLCMKFPRTPVPTFVKKDEVCEPYVRCLKIRERVGSDCPDFEQLKKEGESNATKSISQ